MAGLTLDRVRQIGTATARRVIGDTFDEVGVEGGDDGLGNDAYFFVFRFPTEEGWGHAAGLASRLMAAIIDDLQAEGDARFPHVRLLSDVEAQCCGRVMILMTSSFRALP